MKRLLTILTLTALLCGCSKDEATQGSSAEESYLFDLSMGTRSGDSTDPMELTFALFNSSGYATGTYYDNGTSETLTPCDPTDDNHTKDVYYGLYASAGTYQMVAITPFTEITTEGSNSGLKILRHPNATDVEEIFITDPVSVAVDGVALGGSYIYSYGDNDATLRTPRSKLYLNIVHDTEEEVSYSVTSIKYTNIMNEVLFNPVVGYYDIGASSELSPYTDDGAREINSENYSTEQFLTVETDYQTDTDEDAIYLLSGDYTTSASPALTTPQLNVTIAVTGGSEKEIVIPLSYNFLRSYTYTFTLTFESVSITLSGTESINWTTNDSNSEIKDLENQTITLTEDDWSKPDDDNITTTI